MTAVESETAAEQTASVLPKKIGGRSAGQSRGSFSPDMLKEFCLRTEEALFGLFSVKSAVALESVGVERFGELIEALTEPPSVAMLELNGAPSAALMSFDSDMVFHTVDVMLGGDPETDAEPLQRPPSELDNQFCKALASAITAAFGEACNQKIGPGAYIDGSVERIEHRKVLMDISPPMADALSVKMAVEVGQGGRSGLIELFLPLSTIDMICGGRARSTTQPFSEDNPWFGHMQSSVLDMELGLVAVLHKEKTSVAEVSRFDVGTVIPLPGDVLTGVQLLLDDGDDAISTGELGASTGRRGVRLSEAPSQAFFGPLRDLVMTVSPV